MRLLILPIVYCFSLLVTPVFAQQRGSIVEDRAAKKLLQAGDARLEADETEKAVEIWKSVIERYPRSNVRFDAHMQIGELLLEKKNAYEEARRQFEAADVEANQNSEQRALAALKTGVCFHQGRLYGQSFKILRRVIEDYPASPQVNDAYYYIGLGHFKLGHYSRAIESLEKVGTTLNEEDSSVEKVEAGKRLYVKVNDQDLAVLESDETIELRCVASSGDEETVICHPLGRQVKVILGSISTVLGAPEPNNGRLEIQGNDKIDVYYIDSQTADKKFDQERLYTVNVVSTAIVQIKDGSFAEALSGVVIGKRANLEVVDADFDRSAKADKLNAMAEIWRPKTDEEMDSELAEAIAKRDPLASKLEQPKIEKYRKIDEARVSLTEAVLKQTEEPAPIHTGVFRSAVAIENSAEPKAKDSALQAQSGDVLKLRYTDKVNLTRNEQIKVTSAQCIEGNLGNVRVTKTEIDNPELRIQTQLRSADALTNIGNHYKDFGLQKQAEVKYAEALSTAEEVLEEARKLGGSVLENAYVQIWQTYFAMENYTLAVAMSQRLMREFPNSAFVDEAMLQQADAFRKQKNYTEAIQLYGSILRLNASVLKGEAQFGIAESYEAMAAAAPAQKAATLYERSFVEYRKVYEQFPDSGRVGDSVAKMANFYYKKKDYSRAVDVFENVLSDYPDANFLDVILYNYGRCLYRLGRKAEARRMFDQLINEFPESNLAVESKKISDALVRKAKEGS